MRFGLIQIEPGDDEVALVVPSAAAKTAVLLPLHALPRLLDTASISIFDQHCERCGEPLPGLPREGG